VVSDYSYSAGGVEQFVFEFISRARSIYDLRLLTWDPATLAPDGVPKLYVHYGDLRPAIAEFERADVVLLMASHNLRLLAVLTMQVLADRPQPLVTVLHTSGHSSPDSAAADSQLSWLLQVLKRSARVVAVSEDVEASVLPLIEEEALKVSTIRNGARLSGRGRREIGGRRTTVSFIGRPHEQKGFPLFEKLAYELQGTGLQFQANTVSLPPPSNHSPIDFTYDLDEAGLRAFFDRTDLLVAPYIRADGLPLALLEALNCGVPVVGFDSPGVGRLLRENGQIVIPANYGALREAVSSWARGELLVKPPTQGRIAGWDEQMGHYMRLIEDVFSQSAPPVR
jgi:glycosyltransferase involved in cell wall biosynthesis